MTDKDLEKIERELGPDALRELEKLDDKGLSAKIVSASEAMAEAKEELEANEKYQALKEDLKALRSGKQAVDRRQKAIIAYAIHLRSRE